MNMVLKVRKVSKSYPLGKEEVKVLKGISLTFRQGEIVAIVGPSGSGKTTLLNLLGALDRPTSGRIDFKGRGLNGLNDRNLSILRRRHFGFVFQFFNLIPTLTAFENIALPLMLDGRGLGAAQDSCLGLLDAVGLAGRASHFPYQLSGGEMQRVAIARALVTEPEVILADEPTGNLDSGTGEVVLGLLIDKAREQRRTLIMVTHDTHVAARMDRVIRMRDGEVETEHG